MLDRVDARHVLHLEKQIEERRRVGRELKLLEDQMFGELLP